jgi:hypothetical protein
MKEKTPVYLYGAVKEWNTYMELNFLRGLGTGVWVMGRKDEGNRRRRLLLGYRKGMALRSNWGQIDLKEISKYLEKVLKGGGDK